MNDFYKILNLFLNIMLWVILWEISSELLANFQTNFENKNIGSLLLFLLTLVCIYTLNNGLIYKYTFYN
jgi:hypothetical protein